MRRHGILLLLLFVLTAYAQDVDVTDYAPKMFGKIPFRLKIQPGSSISFYAHATAHWFTGTSQRAEGEFFADANGFQPGHPNRLTVPVASLRTDLDARDALMNEFLRSTIHPNITFDAKGFEIVERDRGINEFRMRVAGDLTIRGVTRPAKVELRLKVYDRNVTIIGQYDLRLSDFSLEPPTVFWFFKVRDWVTIKWSLQASLDFVFPEKPKD